MFGKHDDCVDMEGVARVVEEANRFAVNRAEAEAATTKAIREWHEALGKP